MLASDELEIQVVRGESDLDAVRALWVEYWDSLGFSPEFQGFAEELRSLPGVYGDAGGRLLLATLGGTPVATAALRSIGPRACEVKRLYVRPAARGKGIAQALLRWLMDDARAARCSEMFCDTLGSMDSALRLYRTLGFAEVAPYSADPTPGAVFLRLNLGG